MKHKELNEGDLVKIADNPELFRPGQVGIVASVSARTVRGERDNLIVVRWHDLIWPSTYSEKHVSKFEGKILL